MPEDTSKLLGLLEDLAIIGEDAITTDEVLSVTIERSRRTRKYPVEVQLSSLAKLKKHFPGKTRIEEFSDTFMLEGMIFFDNVWVFGLIEKPKPELDINVVPAELAI